MRRRSLWAVALVTLGAPLHAQSTDSARVARLASLGKVWAAAKYFHPSLAASGVDWDSALVAVIPAVRSARTDAEFEGAVGTMLAALGDPATQVLQQRREPAQAIHGLGDHWESDSTLVVGAAGLSDFRRVIQILQSARPNMLRARRIVLDLRAGEGFLHLPFVFAQLGLDALLASRGMNLPAQRSVIHSGFPTQVGASSGGYWSGFTSQNGGRFEPLPGSGERHIAFVVNQRTLLPPIAVALQDAGDAVIVSDGQPPLGAVSASALRFMSLTDSAQVVLRSAETVSASGAAMLAPDTVVRSGDALAVAARLLGEPPRVRSVVLPAAPRTTPAERDYKTMVFPSVEYRVLAAVRWWSAIQYFYPYKELIGAPWSPMLPVFVARMEIARDSLDYAQGVAEMVARIQDSHGSIRSTALSAYFGIARPGLRVRYVEGSPIVVRVAPDSSVARSGIALGDVIVKVDGEDAKARYARLSRYTASSTRQALDATIATRLLNGDDGSVAVLTVRTANGNERELRLDRRRTWPALQTWHDGPVFRTLSGNIGYVDLERLTVPMVDSMFAALGMTKAIIFDMRAYPQGTAWSIAPYLATKSGIEAARFKRPLAISPESLEQATYEFVQPIGFRPGSTYRGTTVMLIDERTISQAEHTGLFFEAANGTKFVGSPSMGANGDVTAVLLRGGISAAFTGHDVRHADGRQLQRVGLTPHVLIRPTVHGIRMGKDEVLDRAIRFIQTGK